MFSNVANGTWMGIALYLTALFLTVFGWFRAEHMVRQRATFRPGIQSGKRQSGQHQAPTGFGGLPFLGQTLFIQLARFSLMFTVMMMLLQLFQGKALTASPTQMLHAILPAISSFGGFFIFIILMMPTLLQLRHLRTLPISTSALAALLVLLPVVPVLTVGTLFQLLKDGGFAAGNFLPFPIGCLTLAATMAIAVPFFIWRGIRGEAFGILALVMFSATIGPFVFPWLKIPTLASALVSLATIALAFFVSRRLLRSSSDAYRQLPAQMTRWGGWR